MLEDKPLKTTEDVEKTVDQESQESEELLKMQDAEQAETPPDIDAEEDMEKLYEESLKYIKEGEVIKGRVVQIERDSALVDVGYKSEGYISLYEFPNRGQDLTVGDEVEVFLESKEDSEGLIVLSKEKANRIKLWEEIERIYKEDGLVEGEVVTRIKGGLTVDIGLKAFLPGSQVDIRPVRNLDKLIGQKFKMKIIKLNRKRGNIVLSRRQLLEEEREEAKLKTLAILEEDKVMEGVVKNITDYGAFIDLGGIDGLLHITDMTWGRINHPSEVFAIGDEVQVIVLKYDPETERVSLGRKQITPDPWESVEDKFPVSSKVKGKVVSLADYGAFVELEEGVEGLVHVSEMSWTKRIRRPSRVVSVGDEVEVVVLNIDKERKRISLGMKQVEPNPWSLVDEKYPVGGDVEGKVRNLTDFGAFVTLEDGIDGLIHISDLSWSHRISHPSEILNKGELVRAKVLNVDKEAERLSLGLKQLSEDPWTHAEEIYQVGENRRCRVVKLTNFGAFAELEEGVEGLIHVSELSNERVEDPSQVLGVDDQVMCKIIKIDANNKKIGLSIKAYIEEAEMLGLEEPLIIKAEKKEEVAEEASPEEAIVSEGTPAEDAPVEMGTAEEASAEEAPEEIAPVETEPEEAAEEVTEEVVLVETEPEEAVEEVTEEVAPVETEPEEAPEEIAPVEPEPIEALEEASAEAVEEESVPEAEQEKTESAGEPEEEEASESEDVEEEETS